MPPVKLDRAEFEKRYRSGFIDPVFAPLQRELDAIVAAAWDAYSELPESAADPQSWTRIFRSGI
jgi:hypothetical protein